MCVLWCDPCVCVCVCACVGCPWLSKHWLRVSESALLRWCIVSRLTKLSHITLSLFVGLTPRSVSHCLSLSRANADHPLDLLKKYDLTYLFLLLLLFLQIHEVRMLPLFLFYINYNIYPIKYYITPSLFWNTFISFIRQRKTFLTERSCFHFQLPNSSVCPQCSFGWCRDILSSPRLLPLPPSSLTLTMPPPPAIRGQRPVLLLSDHCRSEAAGDDITDLEVVRWAEAEPLELIVQTDNRDGVVGVGHRGPKTKVIPWVGSNNHPKPKVTSIFVCLCWLTPPLSSFHTATIYVIIDLLLDSDSGSTLLALCTRQNRMWLEI